MSLFVEVRVVRGRGFANTTFSRRWHIITPGLPEASDLLYLQTPDQVQGIPSGGRGFSRIPPEKKQKNSLFASDQC